MNQVGSSGVGGADGLPQHQQMQDVEGLAGLDPQFVIMRNCMREKIFEYIGRKQSSADWRRRLPELVRRLEEIVFRQFSNKNDYYNMMKGPIEPQLHFAVKTLSAQNLQNQQNQQMSRQIAPSSGYGTMIPTPGITQGTSGSSRMPYVTDNTGLSSSGAGMVPQNASMGTLLPGADSFTQLVLMSGQMSGQAAQMNQVGSSGVGGADRLPQHQQMQDVVGLTGLDPDFVMLRNSMREKIFEYIGMKQSSADRRRRLPELTRRLEEILFRKFSNKNDYYNMMKGPIEPQLQFAIKTLSAQNQQNQQNQQMSRQIAPSSGYGTMIPTPGITQGTSGSSRMPYVTDNTGLSSSGAGMVPQNASMGTSLPASVDMAGSGSFYSTGSSALATANNQNMGVDILRIANLSLEELELKSVPFEDESTVMNQEENKDELEV